MLSLALKIILKLVPNVKKTKVGRPEKYYFWRRAFQADGCSWRSDILATCKIKIEFFGTHLKHFFFETEQEKYIQVDKPTVISHLLIKSKLTQMQDFSTMFDSNLRIFSLPFLKFSRFLTKNIHFINLIFSVHSQYYWINGLLSVFQIYLIVSINFAEAPLFSSSWFTIVEAWPNPNLAKSFKSEAA